MRYGRKESGPSPQANFKWAGFRSSSVEDKTATALAQTSLRKPRYRHGLSSGRKRLGVASYEGAEYILTVREAGEHFCEPCEQKFYIRRPSNNENAGRDRGEPHG